ncbi:YrdB family protein [Streptacidiphilus carbonis]|uniref:YrdB family protein n=1 Tax=Streptacidiphilus carbonis TaxID=105422 RepID=UPI0007C6AA63|nr:YrdB family protein [Streptacidiphilus carbonis]
MIPRQLHLANEGLAFLLELAAFAVLAWWGFSTGSGVPVHLLLGLGTPAAGMVLWGLVAAPRARFRVPLPGVLLVKVLVFGGAAVCLGLIGHGGWAIAFGVVALVNTAVATVDRNALFRTGRDDAGPDSIEPSVTGLNG